MPLTIIPPAFCLPPEFKEMQRYIEDHFPELDARLSKVRMVDIPDILNEFTGLNEDGMDTVAATSARYLDRLKQMKGH